jgi:lysophospholipase
VSVPSPAEPRSIVVITPTAQPTGLPEALPPTWMAPARHGFLVRPDGALLRFVEWTPAGQPRGTIVLLGGRAEFAEKYGMEIARELTDRGFAVHSCDWRGQGLSQRILPDRLKGHIDDFATYLADFEAWLETVVLVAARPLVLLAHSMGGHVGLQHLAERGGRTPLAAALLCAPMTGLRNESAIRTILTLLPPRPAVDARYFYGSGPSRVAGRDLVGNRVTQDQRRYKFMSMWAAVDSRLTWGPATIGWLRQAVRSIRRQEAPGFLERITVPVTVLSAARDKLVDSATHARLAQRIGGCSLHTFADSQHEIMMEIDPIRDRFLIELDRFLDSVAPAQAAQTGLARTDAVAGRTAGLHAAASSPADEPVRAGA